MSAVPRRPSKILTNCRMACSGRHPPSSPCATRMDAVTQVLSLWKDITAEKQRQFADQQYQEEIIEQQTAALAEMSTPLLTISDTTVVMPLVGAVDSRRVTQLMDTLLSGVSASLRVDRHPRHYGRRGGGYPSRECVHSRIAGGQPARCPGGADGYPSRGGPNARAARRRSPQHYHTWHAARWDYLRAPQLGTMQAMPPAKAGGTACMVLAAHLALTSTSGSILFPHCHPSSATTATVTRSVICRPSLKATIKPMPANS